MTMNYLLRRLTPGDVPAIVKIIDTVRREYGVQHRVGSVLEASDRELFATYQTPHAEYFVVLHGDVVVGGAGIAPLVGAGEPTCELQRMYLSAEHRGRGVGRLLLKECLRQAKALGFRKCYAETILRMQEAIHFYECSGFERLNAPLGSSGHDHNDCWLVKDLATVAE